MAACKCNEKGSVNLSCGKKGQCGCKPHVEGLKCHKCKPLRKNFPDCDQCIAKYYLSDGVCKGK